METLSLPIRIDFGQYLDSCLGHILEDSLQLFHSILCYNILACWLSLLRNLVLKLMIRRNDSYNNYNNLIEIRMD